MCIFAPRLGDDIFSFAGDHVEVGDYLFNDGTWGGIPKNLYGEWEKTPVGIVFKVGAGDYDVPGNYGWNENREIRGYAVALEDASSGRLKWGPSTKLGILYNYNEPGIEN